MTKDVTHRTVSISTKTYNLILNSKNDIVEYKHASPSKVADLAIIAGIEAKLREQESV
jgi:hypothetical protein